MMIPVYSVATWLSVMIPKETLMFNTVRDIYEAYVLYIFMKLLIQFLGGENSLIVHLEFKRRIKQPWPLDGLKPLQTDKIFFRHVKQGVLQFVLIKPFTAVLAIVFERYGIYHDGHFEFKSGYLYLALINNISISLSLYCLVLFYMATEERLQPFNPFSKFLCIKAILFFSFWQTCAFTLFLKMNMFDRDTSQLAQNLIISAELVFASIAQSFAFSYRPFVNNSKNNSYNGGSNSQNSNNRNSDQKRPNVLKTIGYVLNVKDVINDAHNTFLREGRIDSAEEHYMEDELKKDKAFNWSDEDMIDHQDDEEQSTRRETKRSPRGSDEKGGITRSRIPQTAQSHQRIIKKQKYAKPNQISQLLTTQTTTIQQHLQSFTGSGKSQSNQYSQVKTNSSGSIIQNQPHHNHQNNNQRHKNHHHSQINQQSHNIKSKHGNQHQSAHFTSHTATHGGKHYVKHKTSECESQEGDYSSEDSYDEEEEYDDEDIEQTVNTAGGVNTATTAVRVNRSGGNGNDEDIEIKIASNSDNHQISLKHQQHPDTSNQQTSKYLQQQKQASFASKIMQV